MKRRVYYIKSGYFVFIKECAVVNAKKCVWKLFINLSTKGFWPTGSAWCVWFKWFHNLHVLCVSKALIHIRNMQRTVIFKADKKCVQHKSCCYPALFMRNTLYILFYFFNELNWFVAFNADLAEHECKNACL